MLDANRQSHIAVGDPAGGAVRLAELGVRCRRRMDGEASGIADVGDVVEHFQRIDKPGSGFFSAFNVEADQRALASLEVGIRTPF